jgi:threonine/homoserine/homoserine lactone efflux protein
MFGITQFSFFIVAVLLLNATPGPDTAYIVGRSVGQGRGAGLMSALGISAGCCVHSLACAFGLTALLAASAAAFTVIKLAGAVYLIYLGLMLLLKRPAANRRVPDLPTADLNAHDLRALPTADPRGAAPLPPATARRSLRALFLQGFWTNVLNPKVVLFFVSFFPQFVSAGSPHKTLAFLVLGGVFVAMSTVWNSGVAWLAGSITRRVGNNPSLRRWLDRVIGSAFVGLGIKIATVHR